MDDIEYKEMIHNTVVPERLTNEEQGKKYAPLLNFLKNETPAQLYRFRQCNENNISAFDQDQLWCSPGSVMNDDFDALLFFDRQKIRSDLDQFFDSFSNCAVNIDAIPKSIQCSIPPELFSVIKSRFVQMNETDIEAFKNKVRDFMTYQIEAGFPLVQSVIQNTLKFACFSEAIDSAAMWGYYGDSGKGFALAYDFRNYMYTDCASCDKSTVCPSSQKANLYRMIYDDTPFDATEFAEYLLQQQMLQTISLNLQLNNVPGHAVPCPDLFMSTKVLLHKSTSWIHEHEW